MSDEPLLQDTSNQFTRLPIIHHDIWEFRETHWKLMWHPYEIDMTNDYNDWKKLNEKEKKFMKYILAFFAAADGIVMKNIMTNFASEVQISEAQSFYAIQNAMEDIHSLTYAKLIETCITDNDEKMEMFNAIKTIPAIKKKAEWALKYTNPESNRFAVRLVAFILIEGLFFSSSFAGIYWFKDKNILHGITASNDFIARDEALHVEFAIMLYLNYITNKLSQDEIDDIVYSALEIEKEFINESLKEDLLGMNSKLMCQYAEFVTNRLMTQLKYTTKYSETLCPFPYMTKIGLQNQTSFFDKRPTEYQKITVDETKAKIDFDIDF
jgi:ribonucleoside-diphosphate reductase beta chain